MRKNRLILFSKQPVPGKVKNRLAAAVGAEAACRVHECLLRWAIARFSGGEDRDFVLAYDPPSGRDYFSTVFPDVSLEPQTDGGLGARMETALRNAFDVGCERAVLIGTDTPTLDDAYIASAFVALSRADVVLGPATDGGYVLIGARRQAAKVLTHVFQDVTWGESAVFRQTLRNMGTHNIASALLDARPDIDTLENLKDYFRIASMLLNDTMMDDASVSRRQTVFRALMSAIQAAISRNAVEAE